ncbi:MAG: hypothetical protein Kow0067_12640 [Coriobacteriia bacterium]
MTFERVGAINPERDATGAIREFMPQSRYAKTDTTPLNPNGGGPFCRFSVGQGINAAGVYVLTLDGAPVYAGKCENLAKRWGGMGYGAISPKNCFVGGQSTNCKINNRILRHAREGDSLELWFHPTADAAAAERALILDLRPGWNSQVPW